MKNKINVNNEQYCQYCKQYERDSIRDSILKVALGLVISMAVTLTYSGLDELFGVCTFTAQVCQGLLRSGLVKTGLGFVCSSIAFVLGFVLSREYNKPNNEELNNSKELKPPCKGA